MTDTAHSALTGTSLHEPKGVAAATVDKIYVSDGAGSGTWKKLSASQLTGTGNSFGAQLLHIRDEKNSGTAGQALSATSWNTRDLNTIKTNEITSSSLNANTISLPAGTYYIRAWSMRDNNANGHGTIRLYNVTDSSETLYTASVGSSASVPPLLFSLEGRFTLAGAKDLALQLYTTTACTGGAAQSFATKEVYSEVLIWKVA